MMELRPIIVDEGMVVLGGNMRLQALKHLGYKEIPNTWWKKAESLTEQEKRRFIITDNAGFGEWDFDELANSWSDEPLEEWGLDVPTPDKFGTEPEQGNEVHECVCSTCGKAHKPA